MIITISILLLICIALLVFFIIVYNRLVRLRTMKEEGWSGIDVQLKKRANLIPNLLEAVKGYMRHEKNVLEEVTAMRSRVMAAQGVDEKMAAAGGLAASLGHLFAVAENYPDLKANANFLDLQTQLADIEKDIEMARRYYNGTVRELNTAVQVFPNSLVAGMFGFVTSAFFEIQEPSERAVPKISF